MPQQKPQKQKHHHRHPHQHQPPRRGKIPPEIAQLEAATANWQKQQDAAARGEVDGDDENGAVVATADGADGGAGAGDGGGAAGGQQSADGAAEGTPAAEGTAATAGTAAGADGESGGENAAGPAAAGPATKGPKKKLKKPKGEKTRPPLDPNQKDVHLSELRAMKEDALSDLADKEGVENTARMQKHDLLFALVKVYAKRGARIIGGGTLEVLTESGGYGFLRHADRAYVAGPGDIYVGPNQIRRFHLRTGDQIAGEIRMPQPNERYFAMLAPTEVNGAAADDKQRRRALFENLTPLFPAERLTLEREMRTEENITSRIIDIIAPIGKGQRGLLVASPKSGKTVILQQIAHAIEDNFPDVTLMVLLIDERPEEVTEMKRSVRGEVVSSTFDEPATRHVQVAELVMEKAKRLVEARRDVVVLLDSITRLARAYNTMQPTSGRVLSGGVDAGALQRPKRFFGAARNVEEGGSLTIIATALVETGSRMDEVIYEEFKGTGNMELHLDRRVAERRTYPAILIGKSGTRREELLIPPADLKSVWVLRKALSTLDEDKAIEMLLGKMRETDDNSGFFNLMKRGV